MKKPEEPIGIILGILILFSPIAFYMLWFRSYSISNAPEDWGDFGDYVGGVSGPIIALLGVLIAVRLNSIQVRLAKPYGDIVIGNYEDCLYVDLRNKGVGTMIIKKVVAKPQQGLIKTNLIDLMPILSSGKKWTNFVHEIEGKALSPGEKLNFLKIEFGETPSDAGIRENIREALSKIEISVEYIDIFNKPQGIAHRNLNEFSI